MKHCLAALLLAAAPAPLFAQAAAPPVDPKVAALRDAALDDDYAWDIVEGLTTEVGPRLAGTPAEARARAWAVAKLFALGFANVRVEHFDMPVWVRGAESAEILAPFPQPLVLTALGNSGATPPQGITGEVVGFDSMAEFEAAPPEAVRGKIVFVVACHDGNPGRVELRQVSRPAQPRPDACQQARRRRRSSSARSAPIITATPTPACRNSPMAPRPFPPAPCRCRMPSSCSASSSAPGAR